MDEFKRNGSGYYDPTPYKALKNVEGTLNIKAGEIWECASAGNELKMFLVLKVFGRISLVLALSDERKCEDDIEVIAKGIKYTIPYMISYKFEKGFVNFVKQMKDDEFEDLVEVVGGHLGFNQSTVPIINIENAMVHDLKIKLDEMTAKYENEKCICDGLQKELAETADELETTQAKLEDKSRELEDHHRHLEHMQEVIHDFKRRGTQHNEVLEKENRTLKIKIELLEEQNERLLDRLIG